MAVRKWCGVGRLCAVIALLGALSQPATAKSIILCLDGTGNTQKKGATADSDITNVARLCNMVIRNKDQVVRYFKGIATSKSELYNQQARRFGLGGKAKRKEAYRFLSRTYRPGDNIYIFGFSRGAAIALDLANYVNDFGLGSRETAKARPKEAAAKKTSPPPAITFMGLWDTVGAFGLPIAPLQQLNIGKKLSLPPNVRKVTHLLAIDEVREEYAPTQLPASPRVEEVWFIGSHADVGGGFRERRLADITLRFMIRRARQAGVVFDAAKVRAIPKNESGAGWIHSPPIEFSEAIRPIRVVAATPDHPGAAKLPPRYRVPRIHNSVFARMKADPNYRPLNVIELDKYLIVE